jgi:hypothetical protein
LDVPVVRVLGADGEGAAVPFAAADDLAGLRAMQAAALQTAVRFGCRVW